jgi:dipeptidyl aminopeptidase/acylaminoacyl peptidase
LLIHGTADQIVPLSQSEQLASALQAVGVRCDLIAAEGADHCFVGYDDIGGLIDAGIDFLDDVLK